MTDEDHERPPAAGMIVVASNREIRHSRRRVRHLGEEPIAPSERFRSMSLYTEFSRQIEHGFRWSNLMLAQSRLSLLTMRLMLREGRHVQQEAAKMQRMVSPAKRRRRVRPK